MEELFGTGEFKSQLESTDVTAKHLSSSIEDLKILFDLEGKVLRFLRENKVENDVVKNYEKLVDYE